MIQVKNGSNEHESHSKKDDSVFQKYGKAVLSHRDMALCPVLANFLDAEACQKMSSLFRITWLY
ncbi:hypothetical protein FXV77_05385 [Sphingobacterium phlebotomi]|uniref:Uncharacterized protein n=1 Tax=Sphingobacterium phlebotomi TaxID=2605433 RepID=A0A5D4H9X6_9SPHI|nr:hypothetical protein [Sphingobacterium phlebotomi]TYR37438.1 hypothetical protein FXV77_05385 [Sphingobacterium phlebotomi]